MKTTLERRQQRRQHRRCATDPSVMDGIFDSGSERDFSATEYSCEAASKMLQETPEGIDTVVNSFQSRVAHVPSRTSDIAAPLRESVSTPCLFQFFATAVTNAEKGDMIPEELPEDDSEETSSIAEPEARQDLLSHLLDCIEESEWNKVVSFLERDPSLARRQVSMVVQGENSKCLLVHYVCGLKDTPVSVVDALVTLNPASLLQKEQRAGRLPVHIAVVKDAFPEVVRYLCQARPQALQYRDQEGNLPLHYAAMHGCPLVLRYLLEAYPEACSKANTRDRFPMHLVAARCYDSSPVPTGDLEAIVQAYPPALLQVDRFGRTPLHLAADVKHPQWQVLQVLISHAPEALTRKDKARKTPLACAKRSHLGNKTNDLVVSSLLEATNQERRRRRQNTSWIPAGLARGVSSALGSSRHSTVGSCIDKSDKEEKDLYCCYG